MNELFLSASRLLQPLLHLFALSLVARGHDHPGGGFVGGLIATAAILLDAAARGPAAARRAYRLRLPAVAAGGLLLMLLVAASGLIGGGAPLEARWIRLELPGGPVELGTPLLFDLGIYAAVLGSGVSALLALEERGEAVLAAEERTLDPGEEGPPWRS